MQRFSKFPSGVTASPVLATCSLIAVGVWTRLFDQADAAGIVRANAGDTVEEMVVALGRDAPTVVLKGFSELLDRGVILADEQCVLLPQVAAIGMPVVAGAGPRGGKSSTERSRARRDKLRNGGASSDATATAATDCNDPCNGHATGSATDHATDVQRDNPLHATGCNGTDDVQQSAANAGESCVATAHATGATGSATDHATGATGYNREREETEERDSSEEDARDDHDRPAPPLPSKPSTSTKVRPDHPPHPVGSIAAKVVAFIRADVKLGPICPRPNDLANRLCDEVAYPALDPEAEIRKASNWLAANPAKAKRDGDRFLIGWFGRAQENFRGTPPPRRPPDGGAAGGDGTFFPPREVGAKHPAEVLLERQRRETAEKKLRAQQEKDAAEAARKGAAA